MLPQQKRFKLIVIGLAMTLGVVATGAEQATDGRAITGTNGSVTASPGERVEASPSHDDYVIGPGDQLRVFVLQNSELSTEVPVRPDGKISTPLVDDMVAAGKTPSALARELELRLKDYVRNPVVNVIVTRPASTFSQVKVVGQAANPKAIPYRAGLTVLDVLIEVGGLSQFAAGNRAKLIRVDHGTTRVIKVRLLDLLNKGDISQNLVMQPGDVLMIPESYF